MKNKNYDGATVFNIPALAGFMVPGYEVDPSAPWAQYIPEIDPDYTFSPEGLRDIVAWWRLSLMGHLPNDGFFAFGPRGSGKTTLINQLAARLGIPLVEVNAHGRMEVDDLLGRNTVIGGDIMFQDGPFTTAARLGAWVLVNEADAMDPSQQIGLNTLAERRPFLLPVTGETVVPHPNFRVLATGNTNFAGDQTGNFAGTQQQNSAFADRFLFSECDYPAPEVEEAILASRAPGINEPDRKKMVEFAGAIRTLHKEGNREINVSTRGLVRWAILTWAYSQSGVQTPIAYAMMRAFGFQASEEGRVLLTETLQRIYGEG